MVRQSGFQTVFNLRYVRQDTTAARARQPRKSAMITRRRLPGLVLAFVGAALGLLIQRGGTDDADEDTGATVPVRSERHAAGISPEPVA